MTKGQHQEGEMCLFRILGPVTVGHASIDLSLFSTPKARAVLAALALHPRQWISKSRLAEFLWYDPPASAEPNLRTHAAVLRRALDAAAPRLSDRLETARGGGFRLRVIDTEVDCHVFTALAAHGNRELRDGQHDRAAVALAEGLRLWRGPLGEGLTDTAPLREDFEDLNRVRRLAQADLCEARLRLAEAPLIVNDLYQLSAESPLAERPVALLMEALFSSGNPAEAVTEYHRYRRTLADETGTGPGLELQDLYRRLLRRDEDRGGLPAGSLHRREPRRPSSRSSRAASTAQ